MQNTRNSASGGAAFQDAAAIHRELHRRFGLDCFRPGQEEIIRKVLAGQNVLAIFPAGYGKSLLYQLPAALLPGTTLVFSPLAALMHDQQSILENQYGLPSACLTHVVRASDPRRFYGSLKHIQDGRYKVVFIAPERLDDERVMNVVRAQPISLVVLDEAHCISLWGHDFRPHYRRILSFVADVGPATVLGLTATAPPSVEADILRQMPGRTVVSRLSPRLDHLHLHAIAVDGEREKLSCLARIIPRLEGNGIVYCGTQEECEKVAEFLTTCGIESAFYHAGLGEQRATIERDFLSNRWKVVVSTCALGMGIDKPDVRFVVHYRIPGSPELYYQEIGRAGRDGRPAKCILLFDRDDRSLQEFFLRKSQPKPEEYGAVYGRLDTDEPKSTDAINSATGLSRSLVEVALENLVEAGLARRKTIEKDKVKTAGFCRTENPASPAATEPFVTARRSRLEALDAITAYGETTQCLMRYLCRYLGESETQPCCECTNCRRYGDKYDRYREPLEAVDDFLASRYPRINARREHNGGYVLDFHAGTEVGEALSRAKYGGVGTVDDWVVEKAVDCIAKKYLESDTPVEVLTFIQPSSECGLVEDLAHRLARRLKMPCVALLERAGPTELQKAMRTREEKRRNIRGAFAVVEGADLRARSVLLIDDIYDSGWTFREAARTIRKAFPACRVRVFALTRTHHSDDY